MQFTKLHGTGNDFILVDSRQAPGDWPALARAMCDRHFGVGADGLIFAAPSTSGADIRMRIFNADGSEAEMCGNGMRCLVRFAVDVGLVTPRDNELDVQTEIGNLGIRLTLDNGQVVRVRESMGSPRLDPREIPVNIDAPPPITNFELQIDGHAVPVTLVSMGNPHAILFQESPVADFNLHRIGPLVENHILFPRRTNFEVVRVLDRSHAEMRVWERGVGETLACGSGAAAVAVAARLLNLTDGALELTVPGGILNLEWDGEGDVILTGPVKEVFRGTWPSGASV